jgi:uncharacterized protein
MMSAIEGVAILMWASGPDDPVRCATPFMHAAAAAALDMKVEMHFSAQSVLLLKPGVADALYADRQRKTSIADHMQQAHEHGVLFLACASAIANEGLRREDLISAVDGLSGATSFEARVCDPAWRTLVF